MARGTVRQRSKVRKDSWTVQVYTGVDPKTGKKQYHSEAVKGTKASAQRRLTEFLREVDTGNFVEPTRLTVGSILRAVASGFCRAACFQSHPGELQGQPRSLPWSQAGADSP